MGMANGTNVIKGTFTIPSGTTRYSINFGKTFNRYVVYVEMIESDKVNLYNNAGGNNKIFGFLSTNWDGCSAFDPYPVSYTIRTNGSGVSIGNTFNATFRSDGFDFDANGIGAGVNYLYWRYTYNYMIIPID